MTYKSRIAVAGLAAAALIPATAPLAHASTWQTAHFSNRSSNEVRILGGVHCDVGFSIPAFKLNIHGPITAEFPHASLEWVEHYPEGQPSNVTTEPPIAIDNSADADGTIVTDRYSFHVPAGTGSTVYVERVQLDDGAGNTSGVFGWIVLNLDEVCAG